MYAGSEVQYACKLWLIPVITSILLTFYVGLISLNPRFSNTLGGTPMVVSGPRFMIAENDTITCSFNRRRVNGIYVDSERALCISPRLTPSGTYPFEITVTGSNEFFGSTNFINCKLTCLYIIPCVGFNLLFLCRSIFPR